MPQHIEALSAMVISVRREMHENRAAREGVCLGFPILSGPVERNGRVQRFAALMCDSDEIAFSLIEQRKEFICAAVFVLAREVREFRQRVQHWPRRAAGDAIGPSAMDTDDVSDGVVERAKADLEFLVKLFVRELLAEFKEQARTPGIGTDEDLNWVVGEVGHAKWYLPMVQRAKNQP